MRRTSRVKRRGRKYAPFSSFGGSIAPQWNFEGAVLDLDFAGNRAFQNGQQSLASSLVTVTNATGGYVDNSAGLWTLIGANLPRRSDRGLLVEIAATNLALWCRDFTNAVWVKVNTTAALTATGIDGVANSASTLTATANAGTILQTIVLSSAARTLSFWVKRRTGTGTISISQDGLAWTDVTASINSSTYSRVTLTATQLNPIIGFQFGTNTDAVDVDFCGLVASTFATSPILTTTVSATRNLDVVALTSVAGLSIERGTIYAEVDEIRPLNIVGPIYSPYVDTSNYITIRRSSDQLQGQSVTSGAAQATVASTNTVVGSTVYRVAYAFASNDFRARLSTSLGADPADDTSGSVSSSAVTGAYIGNTVLGAQAPSGYIRRIAQFPDTKANQALAAMAQG